MTHEPCFFCYFLFYRFFFFFYIKICTFNKYTTMKFFPLHALKIESSFRHIWIAYGFCSQILVILHKFLWSIVMKCYILHNLYEHRLWVFLLSLRQYYLFYLYIYFDLNILKIIRIIYLKNRIKVKLQFIILKLILAKWKWYLLMMLILD